jgi:hypothetical protein
MNRIERTKLWRRKLTSLVENTIAQAHELEPRQNRAAPLHGAIAERQQCPHHLGAR